ncbi:MAG: glycine zipper 2TM domain-containing protein [Burkholderiales bacterium]|nr:glycine zipper 2TM domain-containing protein [Burkholderiales bacterium]
MAGALLGSQVGSGRGRDAATAVGAVAGTVIADRVANPNSPSSTTGAVVGGAAGALLGNQVGQGSGRTAATAAGAIGGAMIGDRMMSGAPPAPAPVAGATVLGQTQPLAQAQPCRVVDGVTREALRGYSVVYRYAGRDITTTMPYHPGNSIRIAVGAADSMTARPAAPPPPPPGAYYPAPTGTVPPQAVYPQVPGGVQYVPR